MAVVTDISENASNLDIGRTADANYLAGKMDDVRIYDRALSPAEVAQLYKLGTVRITQ